MTSRRLASTISFLARLASRSPRWTVCTTRRNSEIGNLASPAIWAIAARWRPTSSTWRSIRRAQPRPGRAPPVCGDKPAVQFIKLLDEMLDAGVVEAHLAQQLNHLVLQLVVTALGGARQLGALDDRGDPLILDLVELFVDVG